MSLLANFLTAAFIIVGVAGIVVAAWIALGNAGGVR